MMLKIGLVGVGHLGRFHAEKLKANSLCQLVGIYDSNPERCKLVAEEFNLVPYPGYEELLQDVEAVDIAATTSSHYELAKAALEQGKHIFIEKPITSELWQAEELVNLANQKGLKIQVGHIERFNPVTLMVENLIEDPLFIESHRISSFQPRGTDVPVVLDLMIHDIDLILDFVQGPVKQIYANGVGIFTPSIDIANARIEFENGSIANVTSSRVSLKQERKIRFFQSDAYISLDFIAKVASVTRINPEMMKFIPLILQGKMDIKPEQLVEIQRLDLSNSEQDALALELNSFIEAVLYNKKPIVDGQAGYRALKVAMQIMDCINHQPETHI
ncbi:MAG: Gfo/Idh/MocA family oxidoreductase [Candidatus Cloacimonadaceae bacterium]|jgi:predicted dehydrogenase|nr:Gfo/Idh/MocA family oxidoreductase [Candidatus Cloacimonadota bacterium]MCB5257669.1 Gfo/Idh/MocA family oxidoreductase [Candidatus Cloacimonadota bacterium]MDD5624678.1 Gfo/Idh/MocA family oxidoreductase [Candidatus Cloacimonadota bacterium]MDY0112608.1 Gfo/Idh/MocA family oxidoreductase [Candidatus Syntrophosphaera sp.]